jgi:hypothetical protein
MSFIFELLMPSNVPGIVGTQASMKEGKEERKERRERGEEERERGRGHLYPTVSVFELWVS